MSESKGEHVQHKLYINNIHKIMHILFYSHLLLTGMLPWAQFILRYYFSLERPDLRKG